MSATAGTSGVGLRLLSVCLGVFLFGMGFDKIAWLTDAAPLTARLEEWRSAAPATSRWYLETLAIPGAPVFSRLVPIGELATGAALVFGVYIRVAAAIAFLMVLNFHFASDLLFHAAYLTNPYGLPILGGLLALAVGGARLPLSAQR